MSEAAQGRTIADRHVHPATIFIRYLDGIGPAILGLPALFIFGDGGVWIILAILSLMAFFFFLNLLIKALRWQRFMYGIGEREVVIQGGLLSKFRRSIPFSRIQDVSIERGPVSRLLGLAKVRVETGGGAKDEGVIDSVILAEAERIRAVVRAAKARMKEAPAAAPEETETAETTGDDERLLYEMSPGRVLLQGAFSFSLAWLAAIAIALQFFGQFIGFGEDAYERLFTSAFGLAQDAASQLADSAILGAIILAVLLAAGAIILGFVVGIVRTFLANFGFRLTANEDRFLCQRGLLTTRQTAAAKPRIQLARIDSGLIARRFGWHSLTLQSLSGASGDGGHLNIAPFARMAEIQNILTDQPPLDAAFPQRLHPVSILHFWIPVALLTPVFIAGAITTWFLPLVGIAFALGAPLLMVAAWFGWKVHGHSVEENMLFLRRSIWPMRRWVIPVANIECVTLSQNPIQRLTRLSTVTFDTPGGSKLIETRVKDMRLADARDLMAQVKARRRPA